MIANVFNSKFNRWSHKDQFSFFVLLLRNRRERWEIRIKTLISVNWHPRYHIFFGQPRKLWNAIKTIHSFFLLQIMVTTCSSQLLGFAKCQLKLILLWKLNENRLCRWPLALLLKNVSLSMLHLFHCGLHTSVTFALLLLVIHLHTIL